MLIEIEKEIRDYCWEKVKFFKIKDFQREIKTITIGNSLDDKSDITYGFVGNTLIVTGAFGNSTYRFEKIITFQDFKETTPMELADHSKDTNSALAIWEDIAKKSIDRFILDWCNVDSLEDLNIDERILYSKLMSAIKNYSYDVEVFWRFGLLGLTESGLIDWFNVQLASILYDNCFGVSEKTMIHWLGLQIIIEELEVL